MSMKYEDLQRSENEKKSPGINNGPFPPQAFLQSLCSGPRLLLLSLGLSLLLLVGICVIGSKNSKFQRDVDTLRATFSNQTSNTLAEVQALHSQARGLDDKVVFLETKLEKQQQQLQDYSGILLQVQLLAQKLKCKMAALKNNDSQNTCCPIDWLEHEGSCYWVSHSGLPWPEAEKYCQRENSHLVVINSREEQNFVQEHIGSSLTWMGLSDAEGVWKWVDGTDYETNFKNWAPDQPDDWKEHWLGGGEDCAHFRLDGSWNDDVCQRSYHWICEDSLGSSL